MTGKATKQDRPKRGFKLFFFPKAQGQKHKHKKNKYYVSHKDESSPTGSIMSGDSPLHNNRTAEAFSFNADSNQEGRPQLLDSKQVFSSEGRSSPVPTTSKEVAVQSAPTDEKVGDRPGGKGEVLAEPIGDKDKEDKDEISSPTSNHDSDGEDQCDDNEERRNGKKDSGEHEGGDKKEGKNNFDKLDGQWIPPEKKQQVEKEDEKEEEDSIVKCLSVTMACCECSIM
ncbi:uncharacterized protein LOC109537679 isoform X3 [Dendroctonus ponderosae]|nr:uncharacterized protein LOC109537679 isoform X3 [Dendroctonus ponderosae]KAH1008208.1 hypothetical protein HUJ05_008785 [Dendroctonus ponderosae]KAH1008209.1 hypothetical protein HUJ05_008785 [Dendroctonus ponderosae]